MSIKTDMERKIKELSEDEKVADLVYEYFITASEGKELDKEKLIEQCQSKSAADEVRSLCEVVDFLVTLRNVKRKKEREKEVSR